MTAKGSKVAGCSLWGINLTKLRRFGSILAPAGTEEHRVSCAAFSFPEQPFLAVLLVLFEFVFFYQFDEVALSYRLDQGYVERC